MILNTAGKNIKVKIERRNRKTIKISVESSEMLKVSAPSWVDNEQIEKFLYSKKNWISDALERKSETEKVESDKYSTGNKIFLMGNAYIINTVESSNTPNVSVMESGNTIYILINPRTPGNIKKELVNDSMKNWYISHAKKHFPLRIRHFSNITGLYPEKIFYKFQKTRWGSCSGRKNINFNVNLIIAPESIIDYVILHELCHLKHLDHSKNFWNLMEKHMPDYKNRRKWLKENGHLIKI